MHAVRVSKMLFWEMSVFYQTLIDIRKLLPLPLMILHSSLLLFEAQNRPQFHRQTRESTGRTKGLFMTRMSFSRRRIR